MAEWMEGVDDAGPYFYRRFASDEEAWIAYTDSQWQIEDVAYSAIVGGFDTKEQAMLAAELMFE